MGKVYINSVYSWNGFWPIGDMIGAFKKLPQDNLRVVDSNTAKEMVHYLTCGLNDIDALSNELEAHFIQLHCFKQRKAELDPAVMSFTNQASNRHAK